MERHLHIAILTQGFVRWEQSNYLHHLVLDPEARKLRDFSIQYYVGDGLEGRPVSSNRNRIVRDRPAHSDLLMIDQDVIPSHRLFEIACQGLDVVVCPVPIWRPNDPGDCPVRVNMNASVQDKVMTLGAEVYDKLLEGGTGAIYISDRVLSHPAMRAPFHFRSDEDGVGFRGEDYDFCIRAREAGFEVWSANAILCGHIHDVNLLTVMRRFYELMERAGLGVAG
jgi:hypothetical protein